MSLLQWRSEYSVGIESIDDEHREMIDLINGIYAKLGNHPDTDQIERALGDVFKTISMHFALEERIMRKSGYEEFREHKEDHERLLEEIRDLMDKFDTAPDEGAALLERKLSDWFAVHFATFDARLHGMPGSHGPKP